MILNIIEMTNRTRFIAVIKEINSIISILKVSYKHSMIA
jgi:hypothetical protein